MGGYGFSTYASIANFGWFDSYIWIPSRYGKVNFSLGENQPAKEKENINDSTMNQKGNIKK